MTRDIENFNSIKYSNEQPHHGSGLIRVQKSIQLIGKNKTVLDIGCWDGSIAEMIKLAGNNQVDGVEVSKSAIQKAKAKNINVHEFNLESIWPALNKKYDVVFAGEIIEHVFDTDQFLQNIRQVLVSDGKIVITTPNIAAFGRRLMLLFGINPIIETTAREHDAGHIRYFTKTTLLQLLQDNGFEVLNFKSDVINFTSSGNVYSSFIPRIFPTLGRSLIVSAKKIGK